MCNITFNKDIRAIKQVQPANRSIQCAWWKIVIWRKITVSSTNRSFFCCFTRACFYSFLLLLDVLLAAQPRELFFYYFNLSHFCWQDCIKGLQFRMICLNLSVTAYKDKIKEMSMLSLLCSCFYTQPHPNSIYQCGGQPSGFLSVCFSVTGLKPKLQHETYHEMNLFV